MSLDRRDARLTHLEQLLLWEGRLRRSRLMVLHGLSEVRASEWLRELREAHPDWVRWDPRQRTYFATETAYREAPRHARPTQRRDPARGTTLRARDAVPYLFETQAEPSPDDTSPTVAVLPWDFSQPTPKVFATLRMAIEDSTSLRFAYCSMATPEPHERTLEPHTLICAGRRWHVRGYCLETRDFRDFVLGRLTHLQRLEQAATTPSAQDTAWTAVIKVRLVAHPHLSQAQQSVVRMEYFGGTAARVESCRGALLPYFVQDVRAAVDSKTQLPPDYQLAVDNPEDCRPWMFRN